MELQVLLGARDVGVIRSQPDGRNELAFSAEYLASSDRPVLGQYFEDHLDKVQRSQLHLPDRVTGSSATRSSARWRHGPRNLYA